MVVQCPDDLVPAQHPVRMVMALVERLDVRFCEPIKAREGVAGGVVVVWVYSRDWIGAGVGAAL